MTRSHLRVYPAEGLRTADRTTLKKVFVEDALDFAAPFSTPEGPALACLTSAGRIVVRWPFFSLSSPPCRSPSVASCGLAGAQVYELPGLEELLERPVEAVLGFPLPLPADPHRLGLLPRLCSLSTDGQLALVPPRALHARPHLRCAVTATAADG